MHSQSNSLIKANVCFPFADDFGEEISPEMWQEAAWTVIDTFFEEKGLVRQQIDSFNEFVEVCMVFFTTNHSDTV